MLMQNLKPLFVALVLIAIAPATYSSDNVLPPALLGKAGPLEGETLNYYETAFGYIAEPKKTPVPTAA